MKILEPFAGYKLASGHPFMHLALFTGSFTVRVNECRNLSVSLDHSEVVLDDYLLAIDSLRWGHLICFFLGFPEMWAARMADT